MLQMYLSDNAACTSTSHNYKVRYADTGHCEVRLQLLQRGGQVSIAVGADLVLNGQGDGNRKAVKFIVS